MTTTTEEHGASSVHRWAACPGSRRLERDLPDQENENSQEGTLLHLYMAEPTMIPATLTQDQQDLLKTTTRLRDLAVKSFCEKFGIPSDEPYEIEIETKSYLHRGIKVILPGQCDERRYYPRLKIQLTNDYKFGRREVTHAAANLQMRAYALMGAEQRPVDIAGVAIIQPRLEYEYRLTLAAYSALDLLAARQELYGIIDATERPDAPLYAGEEQCRWCKAKLDCPAYGARLLAVRQQASVALDSCSDEQLDQILLAIKFAAFVEDQAKDEARSRIAAGGFPQWKVGKDSTTPNIADSVRAKKLLMTNGFNSLTEQEIMECATIGMGKLYEMFASKGHKMKDAKELVRETLAPVLALSARLGSLTRVKDADFKSLEESK